MTKDKELLELAAKAANYELASTKDGYPLWRNGVGIWNPLTDDGDALRLAVKLGILSHPLLQHYFAVETLMPEKDPYLATRRAIVRAVAEIGKTL
jgi:hypothetical protein